MSDSPDSNQDKTADEWTAGLPEQDQAGNSAAKTQSAKQAPMESLESQAAGPSMEDVNMDVILEIPVSVSMEVGRTSISIRNLLQLNQGSVVELDRIAGEPLDVMVNGTLIAHGEVVVVNEKYGIRLTDVISASERIRKLK